MNKLALIFFSFFYLNAFSQCNWTAVGPNDFNQISFCGAGDINVALDSNDIAYIIFADANTNGRASVVKRTVNRWDTVGAKYLSAGGANYVGLVFNDQNIPYAVYSDIVNAHKIAVKTLAGGNWIDVGPPSFSSGADYCVIALDSMQMPWVAYGDGAQGGKATVARFNGTSWITIGLPGFSAGVAVDINLKFDNTDTPYVVYSDASNNKLLCVMKFNGTNWVSVGTPGANSHMVYHTSLAIDASNNPYVAFVDQTLGSKASVLKFSGGSWNNVGNPAISPSNADFTDIGIDNSGFPYIVYEDFSVGNNITVQKFNGSAWIPVGIPGFTSSQNYSQNCGIVLTTTAEPVIIYNDLAAASKVMAYQFSGSAWTALSDKGISGNGAWCNSAAVDKNGTPYVFYSDGQFFGSGTVKKFNGTDWVCVGPPGFAPSSSQLPVITVDTNNIPYIAYQDGASSGASVMLFNGSNWALVDTASFSPGAADYLNIAIDKNNYPNIIFRDGSMSGALTVMKFDGTHWSFLGSQGFYGGGGNDNKLVFDNNNNAYAACINSWQPVVMKYDGINWSAVGSPFPFLAKSISLSVDVNNVAYMAVIASNDSVYVMNFNGANWSLLGNIGHVSFGSNISLTFNKNNYPCIAFGDANNYDKVLALQYNGVSWSTLGATYFSAGQEAFISLATDFSGNEFILYSSDASCDFFVKKLPCNTNEIKEISKVNFDKTTLFPNPSSGQLHLQSDIYIKSIRVFDLLGNEIKNLQIQATNSVIDLTDVNTGIYFIELHSAQGTFSKKVVIFNPN